MPPQPTGKTYPQKCFGDASATKALDRLVALSCPGSDEKLPVY